MTTGKFVMMTVATVVGASWLAKKFRVNLPGLNG